MSLIPEEDLGSFLNHPFEDMEDVPDIREPQEIEGILGE